MQSGPIRLVLTQIIAVCLLFLANISTAQEIITVNGFLDIGALDNEGQIAEFILWTGNEEYTIINNESSGNLEEYVDSYLTVSGTPEYSGSGRLLLKVIDFTIDFD